MEHHDLIKILLFTFIAFFIYNIIKIYKLNKENKFMEEFINNINGKKIKKFYLKGKGKKTFFQLDKEQLKLSAFEHYKKEIIDLFNWKIEEHKNGTIEVYAEINYIEGDDKENEETKEL